MNGPAKEALEDIRQQQQKFRESVEERYRHEWMSFETRQKRFIEEKISELKGVLTTIERQQAGRNIHGKGDALSAPLRCLDVSPIQDTVLEGEIKGVYHRQRNDRCAEGRPSSSTTRYRATVRSQSSKAGSHLTHRHSSPSFSTGSSLASIDPSHKGGVTVAIASGGDSRCSLPQNARSLRNTA